MHIFARVLFFNFLRRFHTMEWKREGHGYYETRLLKLGAEARGLSLQTDPHPEVIAQIKNDVTKYRLLVFRDQGVIGGARHVEISRWFGEPESTFYKHHRSPHPDVFRVSNDRNEGCTGVGRTGWHIDGSFQEAPFSYSLYHIVSVPDEGDTVFVPLTELIEKLTPEKRALWERLWMVSDMRANRFHPHIYAHPQTLKPVLCFHLGMTEGFIQDYGSENERRLSDMEAYQIMQDIHKEITKDDRKLVYSHKWTAGDFIFSDNLAVGHEASPDTQKPRSEVGLRVMHRTTIKGTRPPAKHYDDMPTTAI